MDELTIDELTLFRDFRSDSGGPSAAETTAARARLLDVIAGEGAAAMRRTSWRHRMAWLGPFGRTRFWAPAAAAAAVIAVVVTMSLLASSAPTTTHIPKPSQTSPTHRPAHPHHGASHPGHQARGSSTGAPSSGQPAGKGAGSAGSVSAPGSPGGTGPGVSPAPSIPTTTAFVLSPASVVGGQRVTLTATVTDQAGGRLSGGTVSFAIFDNPSAGSVGPAGGLTVCSSPLTYEATGRNNVATCSYTANSGWAGSDILEAGYSGYGQYELSDSAAEPLTITATPTQTTLTVNPATASPGQQVTLTASITDQAGDDLSGGTVLFYMYIGEEETTLCSASAVIYNPAAQANAATCNYTIPSQILGSASSVTATIRAVYSDDSGPYYYSSSSAVPITLQS